MIFVCWHLVLHSCLHTSGINHNHIFHTFLLIFLQNLCHAYLDNLHLTGIYTLTTLNKIFYFILVRFALIMATIMIRWGVNTSSNVPKCFQRASGDLQECLLTRRSVTELTLLWFPFMQEQPALISTYFQVFLQEKCAHAPSCITRFIGKRTSRVFHFPTNKCTSFSAALLGVT